VDRAADLMELASPALRRRRGEAVLGLHDAKATRLEGSIKVGGQEVVGADEGTLRKLRGREVAMIFQDPLTALHPFYSIGRQIIEAYRIHHDVSKAEAKKRAIEMLDRVGIPQARSRVDDFPHQFSGGMRQRAMIAMSLVNDPKLLIADEPTTALDVTIQAQILDLLMNLQTERNMGLVLITHNMGVVADTAKRVMVMYAGQIMEERLAADLFASPQHPYTAALLAALPERSEGGRLATIPGVVPGLYDRPRGCLFSPRCAYATEHSRAVRPDLRPWAGGHIRCHYPLGDPNRNAEIGHDHPVGTEAAS
jgi:dipeptide transport system ATP-binding protein